MTPYSIEDHAFASAMRIDLGPVEPVIKCEIGMDQGRAIAVVALQDFVELLDERTKLRDEVADMTAQCDHWFDQARYYCWALLLALAVIAGLTRREWW